MEGTSNVGATVVRVTRPRAWLDLMSMEAEDPVRLIRHFLTAFYLHTGLRFLVLSERFAEDDLGRVSLWAGVGLLAAAVLVFRERAIRFGPVVAALAHAYFIAHRPVPGNHAVMDLLVVSALALAVPYTREASLAAANLVRWMCALVYLQAGVQKVLYGAYFNGSFFARMVDDPRFAWFFALVLPADELARLDAAGPDDARLFTSSGGVLAANLAYLTEIASGVLLIVPRTRALGVVCALVTIVGIEVVAREVGFGVGLILMLLLFRPRFASSRWFPALPLLAHALWTVVDWKYPGLLVP